jgi:hypothetical protein
MAAGHVIISFFENWMRFQYMNGNSHVNMISDLVVAFTAPQWSSARKQLS